MDSVVHTSFNAEDRSYFAILKKEIHNLVISAGFSDAKTGEVDIVVAEMTSNLNKHAGGGEILVSLLQQDGNPYVELIAIDNGPGMADPGKMMADGMSTSNTLGHGMGSMQRLSDIFQVYSLKDWGTIVLARIYKKKPSATAKKPAAEVRYIVVAKPGETVSGDGAGFSAGKDHLRIFLGDGLGHGSEANIAVQKALASFQSSDSVNPVDTLRYIHNDVKKTRGLVAATATYYFNEKKWRIAGIGNIATRVQYPLVSKTYIAHNGIVGLNIPNTMKEQEVQGERGQVLIMCSDGIKTRWELQKYVGIFRYDLSILAAALYKDFARKTDDMSVLACRINVT
jgi:anti-sigma regulatory factor (Ser/Thr protein kinase)